MWELDHKKAEHGRIDAFELWYWRRLLKVPWTARRSNQSILKGINLNIHWKDWCWSWNSNTLAIWWEELTHWRPWCWERSKAGGEGCNRGWDGWMVSLTPWTWIWASSRRWWRRRAAVHGAAKNQTGLSNWTEHNWIMYTAFLLITLLWYNQFYIKNYRDSINEPETSGFSLDFSLCYFFFAVWQPRSLCLFSILSVPTLVC